MFGPSENWSYEFLPPIHANTSSSSPPLVVDSDAETTNLPPGLLDSPPHPEDSSTPIDIQQICASLLKTPPTPVLAAPPPTTHPATIEANIAKDTQGLTMRHNKCIAA
jgi:hypothetical protein